MTTTIEAGTQANVQHQDCPHCNQSETIKLCRRI